MKTIYSIRFWKVITGRGFPTILLNYLFSFLFLTAHAQTDVTIGAGAQSFTSSNSATGDCGPIYRSTAASGFDFSIHHHLFTAAELSAIPSGSTISKIAWFLNNGAATVGNAQKFNIYLKNSSLTVLPAPPQTFAALTSGSTLVYSSASQAIPATTGWLEFNLSSFTYTGGGLEVTIDWDISNVAGSPTTNGFAWKNDPITGQVLSYVNSVAGTTLNNARTVRAQTKFTYIGGTPCSGTPAPGNTIASVNPICPGQATILSLQNSTSGSGVTYQWYDNAGAIANATNSTYSATLSTANDFYCDVSCGGGTPVSSNLVSVGISGFLSCYCIPTTTNGCLSGDHITNVTFNAAGNPINNNTGVCLTASYSDYTGLPPAQVTQGDLVPISVSVNDGGTEYAGAWIDYDQSGTFDASEYIALTDADGIAPWIYTGNASIPFGAMLGTTRMRFRSSFSAVIAAGSACATYSYGETEDYFVDIAVSSLCTGTPAPGNTIASANSVCPGTTVNFSLQNLTAGTGVTYQWHSSSGPILGATNPFYSQVMTIADDFYCDVSCNGGTPVSSNLVSVTLNPFFNCYCTPTNAGSGCITNVNFGSLNNTTPGCTGVNNYNFYPTPVPIVYQGLSATFSMTTDVAAITSVWIDWDHSGIFEPAEWLQIYTNATTGSISIPIPAVPQNGVTRMRVRSRLPGNQNGAGDACLAMGSGETEDYLIDVQVPLPCSGVPNPGNTIASATTVCPNSTVSLSLQNATLGTGVTYQWFMNSSPIANATNSTYTATITAASDYYCEVSCSAGTPVASALVSIILDNFLNCYCTSIPTSNIDEEIYQVSVNGATTDPLYANANGCVTVAPGPGSILNRYANFKTLGSFTNLAQGALVPFEIRINECDGPTYFSNGVGIWIDFDQNGLFTDANEAVFIEATTSAATGLSPAGDKVITGTFTVPPGATLGNTVMRIICAENISGIGLTPCLAYTYGETEDFLVNIIVNPPCAGTPNPGNTIASDDTVCNNVVVNFSLQNATPGAGVTYQWFADGVAISGATNAMHSQSITTLTVVHCEVTCSGNTGTSTAITINVLPAPIGSTLANPIIIGNINCTPYINTQTNTLANCFADNNTFSGDNQSSPDVYYQFTVTDEDTIRISTCSSGFDTYIHLLNSAGVQIDSNDDNGPSCAGTRASIDRNLLPGTYYLVCEGFNTNTGAITTEVRLKNCYTLNMKCFIECYYIGAGMMNAVLLNSGVSAVSTDCDSIKIEWLDSMTCMKVDSSMTILHTDGTASALFPTKGLSGKNCYLRVQHRNAIITGSSTPILFGSANPISYDFTDMMTKAKGDITVQNPQVQVGSSPDVFAFYSGDVDQNGTIGGPDGNIDAVDLGIYENDAFQFLFGYQKTDFNGDGSVDLLDALCVETNVALFIFSQAPCFPVTP